MAAYMHAYKQRCATAYTYSYNYNCVYICVHVCMDGCAETGLNLTESLTAGGLPTTSVADPWQVV